MIPHTHGVLLMILLCVNEINEKEIHVHNTNLRTFDFWFKDYKGTPTKTEDGFYFTLELKLIY